MRSPSPRLVMLGAAPETRGSIAAVIEAYRANGLFERWPIQHLAVYTDHGARRTTALAAMALRDFVWIALRNPRSALHVHARAGAAFWRCLPFIGAAAALRCPVILQLHGSGFERFYDAAGYARSLIQQTLARAACVIVPSDSLRAWTIGVCR